VAVGADVEIVDISPRYLNGLTGTVVRIQGARVTVQLDELSTMRLKCEPKSKSKFPVAPDATSYNLTGLPRASCQVASN
jgi:RNase P/RNase MRP subunit p29